MSKIEWTDATWNPVTGCFMVHDGCKNCYALKMSARLQLIGQEKYKGTTERLVLVDDGTTEWRADWETFDKESSKSKPRWSRKFRLWPAHLGKPLGWKTQRSIFVNSMSDLFGEGVSNEYIAAVFAVMALTLQHRYVILTKRPARAVAWFRWCDANLAEVNDGRGMSAGGLLAYYGQHSGNKPLYNAIYEADKAVLFAAPWPLPNVAIGVSVSDQSSADEFLPLLAQIPTVAPIVSVEPMLGPVDLSRWLLCPNPACEDGIEDSGVVTPWGDGITRQCESCQGGHEPTSFLAQVIIGAESGPGARPVQIEWVRDLAREVLDAQTPVDVVGLTNGAIVPANGVFAGPSLFVKQWPVCAQCLVEADDGMSVRECPLCSGTGQSRPAMTRKRKADKTPRLHVPGYVLSNWTQPIRWPS